MGARQLFRGRSTLLLHGPGLRSRPAPVSRSRGHRGAESERSRSPPPRLEEGAARGVAAASSVGRDSHPRPSASARRPRGTRGRRGATTRPAASRDRVHRGAAAHFRPRDAARRPARPPHSSPSAEQRPPRPKRVPGAGHRPRGPPRLAARRVTHISAAAQVHRPSAVRRRRRNVYRCAFGVKCCHWQQSKTPADTKSSR